MQDNIFRSIRIEKFFDVFILRISLSPNFISMAKLLKLFFFLHENIAPTSSLSQALIYSRFKPTYTLIVFTPTLFEIDLC